MVVIGELPSEFSTPHDIPDNQLLPYDEATQGGYSYYVATGGHLANTSHILGNGENRIVGSMEYYNARLTPDQQYSYFVRVYSKHVSYYYIREKMLLVLLKLAYKFYTAQNVLWVVLNNEHHSQEYIIWMQYCMLLYQI